MNAIRHIRTKVFKVTQGEFAKLAGVTQATVSRWENGTEPSLGEMAKIRKAATKKKIEEWDDSLFFRAPRKQAREAAQ